MNNLRTDEERREIRSIFVETGHKTLNALLLVTGGTTVAFFTFLGTALKDFSEIGSVGEPATRGFMLSLWFFVSSVSICIFAYATTYVAHALYHFGKDRAVSVLMYVTFGLGFLSLTAFVIGSFNAVCTLNHALGAMMQAPSK